MLWYIYLFSILILTPYSPSLMQISLIETCSNIQPTKITSFGVLFFCDTFYLISLLLFLYWMNFCIYLFFTLTSGCWSETVWCNDLQLMWDGVQRRQPRGQFPAHPVPPALPWLHQICGKHPSLPSVVVSLGKKLHLPPTDDGAIWQPCVCQSAPGQT